MDLEKNYEQSLIYCQKLAELYPHNPGFLALLGRAYQQNRQYSEAMATFNHALEQDATDRYPSLRVSSLLNLANLAFEMKQYNRAITYYTECLETTSRSNGNGEWTFAWANLKLGECYELTGNRERALAYYERVKKSDNKEAYELAKKRMKHGIEK